MSRASIIVLLALGATLAGFVLATNAGHLRGGDKTVQPSVAAGPQEAQLGWHETYGSSGEQVVFGVDSLEVTQNGWKAIIGVKNDSSIGWELAPGAIPDGTFGLRLFDTGDKSELDQQNRNNALPAVRAATGYDPELPRILEPGASWKGEISAHGALVAGSWVRVVFGTLIAVGKPPPGLQSTLVWITDHTHQLHT